MSGIWSIFFLSINHVPFALIWSFLFLRLFFYSPLFLFLRLFFNIVFLIILWSNSDGLDSCASHYDSLISLSFSMAVFSTKSFGLFFMLSLPFYSHSSTRPKCQQSSRSTFRFPCKHIISAPASKDGECCFFAQYLFKITHCMLMVLSACKIPQRLLAKIA